jgi:hypothetical protein
VKVIKKEIAQGMYWFLYLLYPNGINLNIGDKIAVNVKPLTSINGQTNIIDSINRYPNGIFCSFQKFISATTIFRLYILAFMVSPFHKSIFTLIVRHKNPQILNYIIWEARLSIKITFNPTISCSSIGAESRFLLL